MPQATSLKVMQHGDPADVLQLHYDEQPPKPGRGQVLLRMHAAPINPSDLLFIEGNYGIGPELPVTAGLEGCGTVIDSGGGWLGKLHQGKRVSVVSRNAGTWAKWCVARAETVVPVPKELSEEQAAAYFINPASALAMIRWILEVPQGEWMVQTAAGSALGRMVINLGQRFGFRTLSIVRREEQAEKLRQLGGDAVIVATTETPEDAFVEQVREACRGQLPRYAIDPVGGTLSGLLLKGLGEGARVLYYGSLTEDPVPVLPRDVIVKNLKLESFWLGRAIENLSLLNKLRFIRELGKLHSEGVFQVETFKSFALEDFESAMQRVTDSHGAEKVIFRIGSPDE